jgi:hypothetical protein
VTVLAEVYKIMGSIELLGNPVQLVGNLGDGIMDFFYLPQQVSISAVSDKCHDVVGLFPFGF